MRTSDDDAHSRAQASDLALDVALVCNRPGDAERRASPDLEDIDECDEQFVSLESPVAGRGSPSKESVWLGKGGNPRSPQSAPRPPPRYRREGKAKQVGDGLKEAGDDEAMVAIYRSPNPLPLRPSDPPPDPVWDAARTIELCVHRLREVRGSSISSVSGPSSPKVQLPPALELMDMGEDGRSNAELSRRVSFERVSELAEEARRARAEEAKAKEEAKSLRAGLEELAKQSATWREERHLHEASIEGLQAAHTHALQCVAEYQVTIPLLQAKMTSLKADNRELHSLLARRTEEWQAHAKEQAAQLEFAEAKLAGLARRASDAENRAAASEKVAVRHAVVANEVASKVAGAEERAARIEAEAKRMQGATAAASLAAATELDEEVAGLARDYKELQWRTAALTERCAAQQRELEALREEKHAWRGSSSSRLEAREVREASSPSSPCGPSSPHGIPASPLVPLPPVPGSPPRLVTTPGSPAAAKAADGGLTDRGDTDYVAAVAVHKPQAVAMVLKVLEGEDCDENEGVDGEGAASGAIGALRWLVAEETRTEGNVPGYIRNVEARRTPPNVEARFPAPPEVEARFPTPPTSPNVGAALGASRPATPCPATPVQRAASPVASPATPVHRVGWDSPRPTSPHRALKAPSHPRPSDAVLARLGEPEPRASPGRAVEGQRDAGPRSSSGAPASSNHGSSSIPSSSRLAALSLTPAAIRASRALSSPFSVLVERLSSPTAAAASAPAASAAATTEATTTGAAASAVPPRRLSPPPGRASPPLAVRAQSFASRGARRTAAAARDAALREEVRQQLAKLQAVEEAGRALGDLGLEAEALERVELEQVLDVFVERAEADDEEPLVV